MSDEVKIIKHLFGLTIPTLIVAAVLAAATIYGIYSVYMAAVTQP